MGNLILDKIRNGEGLNKSYEEIFENIAQKLMNKHCLKVGEKCFEFTEIEFYYFHKKNHPDYNVHQHELQQKYSVYFHDKHGRGGVDIGFGDEECYGGILIRGLKTVGNEFTNGPINVADIISGGKDKYNEYVKRKNLLENTLQIVEKERDDTKIYKGPRYGLVRDSDYLVRNYRFVKYFEPKHKFKEKNFVYLASGCPEEIKGFKKKTIIESLKTSKTRKDKLYERYKV